MKQLVAAFLLAGLTACGFQPVYAPSGAQLESSGRITVEPIAGRPGYMLRRELQRELAAGLPGIEKSAVLNVKLGSGLTRLAFKPDGAASRSSVVATGTYVLATEDGSIGGKVGAETSFSVPDAPYGDIAAQSSATDRTMRLLARKIVDDLRLKLSSAE